MNPLLTQGLSRLTYGPPYSSRVYTHAFHFSYSVGDYLLQTPQQYTGRPPYVPTGAADRCTGPENLLGCYQLTISAAGQLLYRRLTSSVIRMERFRFCNSSTTFLSVFRVNAGYDIVICL